MKFGTGIQRYRVYTWPGSPTEVLGDYDVRMVTDANVADVEYFRPPNVQKLFRDFLDESRVGVYAYLDGRTVGHAWCTIPTTSASIANRYFTLRPQEVLIHYCHVAEDARGRGIFKAMLTALIARVRNLSDEVHILIDTESTNTASRRGIEKTGFRYLEERVVLRVAGHVLLQWRANRG